METSRRIVGVRFPDNTGGSSRQHVQAPSRGFRQHNQQQRSNSINAREVRDASEDHELETWKQSVRSQAEEQLLLHQTVMTSKKQQIELQHERLAKQRAFIRHEKRKLLLQNALLESERERFQASLSSDWFCSAAFPSARDRRVTIDVGGQLFELSSALAAKDGGSLLAAFVDDDSPLSEAECGCFRIDRDWWLFRYVLAFLRDGILPQDPKLLRELYLESEFWKLDSLRKAIEMRNMELLQSKQESEAAASALLSLGSASSLRLKAGLKTGGGVGSSSVLGRLKGAEPKKSTIATEAKDSNTWWLDPPLWWGSSSRDEKNSSDAKKQSEPPAKVSAFASLLKKSHTKTKAEGLSGSTAANEQDAWWKSTTYKGVDFVQGLGGSPVKKTSQQQGQHKQSGGDTRNQESHEGDGKTTPRVPLIVNTTWPSSHYLSG